MQSPEIATPRLQPGGLATVAYLKAGLDDHQDHLELFMPLILDVVASFGTTHFGLVELQEGLRVQHGIEMPQQVITTLLRRAERKDLVNRTAGRYERGSRFRANAGIAQQKQSIRRAQERLADAFLEYALSRQLNVESRETALELLLGFVEQSHVAMVLQDYEAMLSDATGVSREQVIAAEFFQFVAAQDPDLRATTSALLQGLVLYYAAFNPRLQESQRSLRDLKVYFDTHLVFQALGYEGAAPESLMRDTIALLQREGVEVLIFEDTIQEIRRIFDRLIAQREHRHSARMWRETPMSRHLDVTGTSLADLKELDALLEINITKLGLRLRARPTLKAKYLLDEADLAARLANPETGDTEEPRVRHDVDCTTAILMLRGPKASAHLSDVGTVFATDSPLVIKRIGEWYADESRDTLGVPPAVHVRALATVAWLKHPTYCADLKLDELLVTCAAALRPKAETWDRFRDYLQKLVEQDTITSDEMVVIFTSSLSNSLLKEAEAYSESDVDSSTLQEIVHRVQSAYKAEFAGELADASARADAAAARADAIAREAAERETKRNLKLTARNRRVAVWAANFLFGGVVILLVVGWVVAFRIPSVPKHVKVFIALACSVTLLLTAASGLRDLWHLRTRLIAFVASCLDRWTAANG